MDVICNDNDSIDVVQTDGLINTISDGEELSFSGCDIDGIMYCLDNWTVIDMNVCY